LGVYWSVMGQAVGQNPLTYATGAHSTLSQRGWRILFWVGLVHFVALVTMLAISFKGMMVLMNVLKGAPVFNWYVIGTLINNFGVPMLVLANALAVMGYWAGLHGRSPRPWFLVYAPVQLGMMLIQYGIMIPLAMHGLYRLTPHSAIGMSRVQLVTMPLAFVLVALPFWLLLIPKIRRACFAA
jgi:hypothetical protein